LPPERPLSASTVAVDSTLSFQRSRFFASCSIMALMASGGMRIEQELGEKINAIPTLEVA